MTFNSQKNIDNIRLLHAISFNTPNIIKQKPKNNTHSPARIALTILEYRGF